MLKEQFFAVQGVDFWRPECLLRVLGLNELIPLVVVESARLFCDNWLLESGDDLSSLKDEDAASFWALAPNVSIKSIMRGTNFRQTSL
jgi:hypothetical protein